jgi:hypothetical protein
MLHILFAYFIFQLIIETTILRIYCCYSGAEHQDLVHVVQGYIQEEG